VSGQADILEACVRVGGHIGFRGQIADVNQLAPWLARLRAGALGRAAER
jgi:hypothetical protein